MVIYRFKSLRKDLIFIIFAKVKIKNSRLSYSLDNQNNNDNIKINHIWKNFKLVIK